MTDGGRVIRSPTYAVSCYVKPITIIFGVKIVEIMNQVLSMLVFAVKLPQGNSPFTND